jgi:hypothetical protein
MEFKKRENFSSDLADNKLFSEERNVSIRGISFLSLLSQPA